MYQSQTQVLNSKALLSTRQFDFADCFVYCSSDFIDILNILQYWLMIDC